MDCKKIKYNLEIKKINNLLSSTDYMSNELQIYLSKLNNYKEDSNYSSETFKNSEIIPNDISHLFKKSWKSSSSTGFVPNSTVTNESV